MLKALSIIIYSSKKKKTGELVKWKDVMLWDCFVSIKFHFEIDTLKKGEFVKDHLYGLMALLIVSEWVLCGIFSENKTLVGCSMFVPQSDKPNEPSEYNRLLLLFPDE